MKRKLFLLSLLACAGAQAQEVTVTPANTTQCVGEIQQLSATAAPALTTLFSENFEGSALGNFTATVISGTVNANSQWTNRTSPYTPPTTVWHPIINSGSKFALSNSDYSGANVNTALESGVLNTTGYTSLTLDFKHYYSDFSTSATGDFAYIEVSIDGGTTWSNVQTYSTDQGAATNFASVSINFTPYINNANFKFRLRYAAAWNDGWAVDDVVVSGMGPAATAFEWAPQAGLYTDADATIPYTGGAVASVYAKPEANATYTASFAGGDGTADITVTNPAAPDLVDNREFCHSATIANLYVDAIDVLWYEDEENDTPLADDTALVSGNVYYASQVLDGCEGTARTGVTVVITSPAAPVADLETQSFCNAGIIGDLDIEGDGILWYADSEDGEPLAEDIALVDGTIYYASQTINGCESILRTAVTAEVNVVEAPEGETTQNLTVEELTDATIEDIIVDAEGTVIWYASLEDLEAGENALVSGTQLESGVTYYGVQVNGECTSEDWIEVTMNITLGIDSFDTALFTYYPNPVKDVLTVSYSSAISSVAVYNLLGQQLLEKKVNATEGTIDMSSLANDIYVVTVTAGNKVNTFRIIKK